MILKIRNATESDIEGVSKLLVDVTVREDPEFQLMVNSHIVPETELLDYIILTHTHFSVMAHPCSFVIEDIRSGEIIGIRLSEPYPNNTKAALVKSLIDKSEGLKRRHHFFEDLEQGVSYPSQTGVSFVQVCIASKYRRRGLAQQVIREAIAATKINGIPFVKVNASSEYSRRIFEKLGFHRLAELDYRTYEQDGRQFFKPSLVNLHSRIGLYMLLLQ
jgi:ribosomal protein S18 acetylase RimI-like enzyme